MLEALTGKALVAHVASIETGFLAAALRTDGLRFAEPGRRHGRARRGALPASTVSRSRQTRSASRTAGARPRPARASATSRRRRRADDGAGLPRAGDSPGPARAADGRFARELRARTCMAAGSTSLGALRSGVAAEAALERASAPGPRGTTARRMSARAARSAPSRRRRSRSRARIRRSARPPTSPHESRT